MFYTNPNFYYITIGLQALCVWHAIRKGRQNNWIWIIVFLPIVGCIAYVFTEMFTGRDIRRVQSGVVEALVPTRRIKQLEENLRFADTFNNRVALADAYLENEMTDQAIELYQSSLRDNFTENEYVRSKLVQAYAFRKQWTEVLPLAKKIISLPQFNRSETHVAYAVALSHTGHPAEAEAEFKKMKAKYSNHAARLEYARFLDREGRTEEGLQMLEEMVREGRQLSGQERYANRAWLEEARTELRNASLPPR